jgi:hypothetical protein
MKNINTKFESFLLAWFINLLVLLIITSVLSLVLDTGIIAQICSILHPIIGIVFSVFCLIYSVLHFVRILGIRRVGLFISGVLLVALLVFVIVTGWTLLWQGSREDNLVTHWVHIVSCATLVVFLVGHLIAHVSFYPKQRRISETGKFKTVGGIKGTSLLAFTLTLAVGLTMWLGDKFTHVPYSTSPIVANYQYNYGPHPFRPSQTETQNNQFIDQRALLTTDKCADCHQDIAKQWFDSAHRQAASDKSYETNVSLLAKKKGIEATRYCEGCHAPLALLTGQLSEGGLHGGIDNSNANLQGVNCQVCHGISEVVNTKGVASYRFAINQAYLFETTDSSWLQNINKLAIHLNPSQHKQDMAIPALATSEYCATCHAQFIDKELNGWSWVKMQDEFSAWLDGPYSGKQDKQFAHSQQMRCQDCHMPHISSTDPSANAQGMIRDHRFLAANTMLPTLNGDQAFLQQTQQFLQSNKVRLSIEPPHRKDATTNQMPVSQDLRKSAIKPFYFYKGELAEVSLIVTNSGVGHNFPGGTIDINEVWIAIQIVDSDGTLVFDSGKVDEEDFLDQSAYQYRSLPTDRNGQIVWRHDLFNMVGKASVNVIKAGESDIVKYQFNLPYWVKGPISVTAQVRYRKLNTRYARWALNDEYQSLPITDLARAFLQIPVREKVEAYDNFGTK